MSALAYTRELSLAVSMHDRHVRMGAEARGSCGESSQRAVVRPLTFSLIHYQRWIVIGPHESEGVRHSGVAAEGIVFRRTEGQATRCSCECGVSH